MRTHNQKYYIICHFNSNQLPFDGQRRRGADVKLQYSKIEPICSPWQESKYVSGYILLASLTLLLLLLLLLLFYFSDLVFLLLFRGSKEDFESTIPIKVWGIYKVLLLLLFCFGAAVLPCDVSNSADNSASRTSLCKQTPCTFTHTYTGGNAHGYAHTHEHTDS